MRRLCLGVLGFSLFLAPLAAQDAGVDDNAVIDSILGQKAISWENAAWLVGRATQLIDDSATPAVRGAEGGLGRVGSGFEKS